MKSFWLIVFFAALTANAKDPLVSCIDRFYSISADSAVKAMMTEYGKEFDKGKNSALLEKNIGERLLVLYDSCLTGKELKNFSDYLKNRFRLNCGDVSFFAYPIAKIESKKIVKKDRFLNDLEKAMSTKLQAKVQINGSDKKGLIEIRYTSMDELNRLSGLILDDLK